jgi:hypothetical protein
LLSEEVFLEYDFASANACRQGGAGKQDADPTLTVIRYYFGLLGTKVYAAVASRTTTVLGPKCSKIKNMDDYTPPLLLVM